MQKGELTHKAILDEAVRIASTAGLDGLTIGSLAARTSLSKSGLFTHFGSKQSLQLEMLKHEVDRFLRIVMMPSLDAERGEPRLRELFDRWLVWTSDALPGGCLFITAGIELDDQPGPVRDYLVSRQVDWLDVVAQFVRGGIAEGHLHEDADPEQFAYDLYSVILGYHHAKRLLGDDAAEVKARRSFAALLAAAGHSTS